MTGEAYEKIIPVNQYSFPSPYGEKTVELYHGDIMEFLKPADIMVFSAFRGSYNPVPGTLIKSFEEKTHESMREIVKDLMINLRNETGVWVSKRLSNIRFPYVACTELVGKEISKKDQEKLGMRIESLFIVMEMLDKMLDHKTAIIMPLLGTGRQGIKPRDILDSLITNAQAILPRCRQIDHIYIVEYNADKIDEISATMDQVLGRAVHVNIMIHMDDQVKEELFRLRTVLSDIRQLNPALSDRKSIQNLGKMLDEVDTTTFNSFALGCRTVLEDILLNLMENPPADTRLLNLIRKVAGTGYFGNWLINYMHIIRTVGNDYAHGESEKMEQPFVEAIPQYVDAPDQKILLMAMNQILIQYKQFLRKNGADRKLCVKPT